MRVSATMDSKEAFKPVDVNIVFDTGLEYKCFRDMIQLNCAIPERVYPSNADSNVRLQDVMGKIFDTLVAMEEREE